MLYLVLVARAARRPEPVDCGCFGGGGEIEPGETQYPRKILENTLFTLCGVWLVVRPRSLASLDRHLLRRA